MNTRTERIHNNIYCAYCGRNMRDMNYGICPEPPLICNCDKAKEEMRLYDELKRLYNHPLHDSLIDKKVEIYKNKLKGISVQTVLEPVSALTPVSMSKCTALPPNYTELSTKTVID